MKRNINILVAIQKKEKKKARKKPHIQSFPQSTEQVTLQQRYPLASPRHDIL
eukprot:m.113842 g.113842  ORF g.113842 m.113842 type:complete len:52 (+) comp9270_c0_seq7:1979-2134(+)